MPFLEDYQPVEDRIRAFWEDHPDGRIVTDRMDAPVGEYVFMAEVYREVADKRPAASGWAHENVNQLPANMKASALEVCETSAIGRCLANLGYAPKGKRPSREEMSTSGGGGTRSAAPEGYGEGSNGAGDVLPPPAIVAASPPGESVSPSAPSASEGVPVTPPDAPSWEHLKQAAGSASAARARLNTVNRTEYTARTVTGATIEELALALASFDDSEFS